jgi:hypothetical protein
MTLDKMTLGRVMFGRMTFDKMILDRVMFGRMTVGRIIFRRITFGRMTVCRMTLGRISLSRMQSCAFSKCFAAFYWLAPTQKLFQMLNFSLCVSSGLAGHTEPKTHRKIALKIARVNESSRPMFMER